MTDEERLTHAARALGRKSYPARLKRLGKKRIQEIARENGKQNAVRLQRLNDRVRPIIKPIVLNQRHLLASALDVSRQKTANPDLLQNLNELLGAV
jgi:hypothetical protein